jgi:hypothetical protein
VYHGARGLVHTHGRKILSSRRVVQFDVAELTAVATINRNPQNFTLARARFPGFISIPTASVHCMESWARQRCAACCLASPESGLSN